MTAVETVPDTWDSERDERFFRATARLLPPAVVEAASSLLASYDEPSTTGVAAGPCLRRVPAQVGRDDGR